MLSTDQRQRDFQAVIVEKLVYQTSSLREWRCGEGGLALCIVISDSAKGKFSKLHLSLVFRYADLFFFFYPFVHILG